jgi:hypothetical protein
MPISVMTRQSLASTSLEDLDNDDRVRVLGIIDRFRELGINEDISLPQVRNRCSNYISKASFTDSTSLTACCSRRPVQWKILPT